MEVHELSWALLDIPIQQTDRVGESNGTGSMTL